MLPVEEYLFARGAEYAQRYRPDSFVCLSESIDLHRVDATRIFAPVTAIAVREDQLVPLGDMRAMVARLPNARAARDLLGLRPRCLPEGEPAARADLRPRFERHTRNCRMTKSDPGHPRRARGPRKLRCDRRRGAAAASVVHLRLPRLRRQAQVRLQPFGQSDARPAGEALADLEGGAGAVITGIGHGRDHARRAHPAHRRAHHRAARLLRRHVPPVHRVEEARRARRRVRGLRRRGGGRRPRCRSRRRCVWIETPSNPLLRITDIADSREACARDRRAGRGGQHLPVAGLAAAARRSARTSSCTRPRSTSTVTATWSAAR